MSFHYSDAVREFKRGRPSNGYKKLANGTYLYKRGAEGEEHYQVKLYNTVVVDIYPDYQILSTGGWHTPLTCRIIKEFSTLGGWIGNNSKCGFEDTFRVNGYPFFDGITIDNCGHVRREDIRSDWKQVAKKEIVQKWKALHMPITKALRGRFDLGEFNECGPGHTPSPHFALSVLEGLDPIFPDHSEVLTVLALSAQRVKPRGWGVVAYERTAEERWRAALNELRMVFYIENDAYMSVEVPNV